MKVSLFIIFSILLARNYAGDCTYTYTDPNTDWPTAVCTTSTNTCNTGTYTSQSPINVVRGSVNTSMGAEKVKIDTEYKSKGSLSLKNMGLTQEVAITDGSITFDNVKYTIAQYHWHQPSEHTFDSMRYDAELHFVHTTTDTNAKNPYLVIAVYFQIGDENSWLKKNNYSSGSATTDGTKSISGNINPWDIIEPAAKNGVYQYSGSFTTPPCTEGVTFLLTRVPQTMSMAQWTSFATSVPNVTFTYSSNTGNVRPAQNVNTNTVYYRY